MWKIGPSDRELDAYGALVDHGPLTAAQLSLWRGYDQEETERLLSALVAAGLVARAHNGAYAAEAPDRALGELVRRAEDDADDIRTEIAHLELIYGARGAAVSSGIVEVVDGRAAVVARAGEIMGSAHETMYSVANEVDLLIQPPGGYEAVRVAAARGVVQRTIFARSMLTVPEALARAFDPSLPNSSVRILSEVPTRLLVVDGRIACIPVLSSEHLEGRMMIVTHSALVSVITELFHMMWRAANPVGASSTTRDGGIAMDPSDAAIMGLLLSGMTDRIIAEELKTSLRTIQRRVHALMQRAGASSRVQLGYEAGRQGWLVEDPPADNNP